jgi:hypothetical protein
MTELRLVPINSEPVPDEDPDDGTLGGLFAGFQHLLSERPLRPGTLNGVLLHLANLARDYRGVELPAPAERT